MQASCPVLNSLFSIICILQHNSAQGFGEKVHFSTLLKSVCMEYIYIFFFKEYTQVWIESNVFRHLIACLLQLYQNAL